MNNFLKLQYVKYILRHCKHMCTRCEFREDCDLTAEVIDKSWKELIRRRKEWWN